MSDWIYSPVWSSQWIALLTLLFLGLAIWRWRRERRGGVPFVLRMVASAILLFIVWNPQRVLPREQTGKPKLIVLVDTSASMNTRDVENDSRLRAALDTLKGQEPALSREFALDVRRFDRTSGSLDLAGSNRILKATGESSDVAGALGTAVAELGNEKARAGVLLISDGRATTSGTMEAAQLALALSVPVWTWAVGSSVPRHDVWIETPSAEALAFGGAEVELTATLGADGYPNQSFDVELRDDKRVVETKQVVPDSNGTARVVMRVKAPARGEQRYLFRVPAQADEGDTSNNERAVFLRSVGDKVRVLIAEGQPHWDTKFLVQSLKRDPNVDLTAVYRLNANRHVAVVSATGTETRVEKDLFPRTAGNMDAFDVIILGRGAEAFFDEKTEELLTQFVAQRGGSLVFARGKPYGGRFQPLAKLEPVAWGEGTVPAVKLRATEAGRENPIFDLGAAGTLDGLLERLPALDQASLTLGEKPLAIVLAEAAQDEGPVLVAYQRYGQGKALSLNASGLWRWAFRETGQEESEIAYGRFWVSLLQWLLSGSQFLPGADVALISARRYYTSEQPMQFLITTRNLERAAYQPRLVITGPASAVEVEPRLRGDSFVAEAGPFPAGSYRVALTNNVGQPFELSQTIEVISASLEQRDLSADPETMRQLAVQSGGGVLKRADIGRLPELVRRWEAGRQLLHRQSPVWDRWYVLVGLFTLLGTEWWCRRREGLL